MNVQEAIDLFLDQCRHGRNLSQHTIRAYTIDLNEFTKYVGAATEVEDCDKEKMRAYLAYLYERGLKETSIKRRMACLKAMWAWLEEEEYLEVNVFHRMRLRIKLPFSLPKSLSRSELAKLMNYPARQLGVCGVGNYEILHTMKMNVQLFRSITTLAALEIFYVTGMRVGELEALSKNDIDFSDSTIRVFGKGGRQRQVIIPGIELINLLRAYLAQRELRCPQTKRLLITWQGSPASTQYIRRLVLKTGVDAQIERRITPHMLRHTSATHYLESGVDIRYVQTLLGHRSISTTEIYTNVTKSALKKTIQAANIRNHHSVLNDNL